MISGFDQYSGFSLTIGKSKYLFKMINSAIQGVSMQAKELNVARDIQFLFNEGKTMFQENRLLLLDVQSIGLLRQDLIDELGMQRARDFYLRFGFQNGFTDFLLIQSHYQFDTEMDLLASGPVIHTWEGIVHAAPKELEFDRETGQFYFTGVWSNSWEAEQHLCFNQKSAEPVCWSLMGYASGWCTAFFGKPLLAIEPVCVGMGHDHCEWKIQPPDQWGEEAKPYYEALKRFFKE